MAQVVEKLPANAGDIRDTGSISESGWSPGGGHGNPLQHSCLEIPWAEDPGGLQSMGSQSRTWLSDLACTHLFKSPISKYSHIGGGVASYVFLGDNSAHWLPRWHSGKEFACQCRWHRRHGFDPWTGKIPWRRKRQPNPVVFSCPWESHGQKSLVGYLVQGITKS